MFAHHLCFTLALDEFRWMNKTAAESRAWESSLLRSWDHSTFPQYEICEKKNNYFFIENVINDVSSKYLIFFF